MIAGLSAPEVAAWYAGIVLCVVLIVRLALAGIVLGQGHVRDFQVAAGDLLNLLRKLKYRHFMRVADIDRLMLAV